MVIVLTGANDFARRAELRRLVTEFEQAYGDFGLERIDASDIDFGRLLEQAASLPFLAPKRMIVLSGLSANKAASEHIDKLLESVADSTELIIEEPKFDKRLNVYKTLKKRADFREFTELDERGLAGWLAAEAALRGGSLKQSEANYLVQRAGTDQLSLSHELDKLLLYQPNIDREAIDKLVEPLPHSSVFDLLDAAFAGNRKRAMELYEEQRRQNVEPQAIMGMIAWQVHVLAVVKYNDKDSPDEVARQAKLNPYVVRKTAGLARNLSRQQVKDLVSRALALDIRLKSEPVDADDAVQHFLLTI